MKKHHHNTSIISVAYRTLLVMVVCGFCLATHADSYTVKKGDTLSKIAKKYGVEVGDLMAANTIKDAKGLQIGHILTIPNPDAPVLYTVRSGDTLDGIARKHHTTFEILRSYNNLKNPNALSIGQLIKLPAGHSSSTVSRPVNPQNHPQLSSSFRRDLNRIPVKRGKWRYIVIHHSGTDSGTVAGMDRYHKVERRMKNGLAYHFVIGNGKGMKNGEVAIGNRWKRQIQGGHLASEKLNQVAIGICLVGNFEKRSPSKVQLNALEALLVDLMNRTNLPASAIRTHRAINNRPTRCPGRRFPISLVMSKIS